MTRLGLRSLVLLVPVLVACGSNGGAGPGAGGAGGSAQGGAGGTLGTGGVTGSAGTSGNGGTGAGGASGAAGGSAGVRGTGGAGGSAGATGGSAGSAGAGGSGGSAGTGGAGGGRGGSSGSSGSGGGAGTAGARGGSGGTSGAGGSTGAAGTGGAASSGLRLEYQNSSATNTAFSVRLTNLGASMPLISTIKVRYYFLDDANHDATPLVAVAQWKLAGTTTTIDLRTSPGCTTSTSFATPPLSSYVDFGCAWTSPMSAQDVITFTLTLNPATQLASNDYSYADTAGAFATNDHLLVLVNGSVQSGTPPP